ncbi:hypothetical protein GCM10010124_26260 [Pilimelia terevasa]|uniref:Uncharacterized protein n=1 Tax=Pilimelia terevasa TaxID=53372 RepID=A0A8J3BNN9_9ACTN|nr:hypothetical protein [Pilimelia terevasa]GGK32228.1 hypothetical protein GCM10010124_26260 [Pilimelia terevasa]
MSIHTFCVELYHPGDDPVPGHDDGRLDAVARRARQDIRDAGLLPAGVTVIEPPDPTNPGEDVDTPPPAGPVVDIAAARGA